MAVSDQDGDRAKPGLMSEWLRKLSPSTPPEPAPEMELEEAVPDVEETGDKPQPILPRTKLVDRFLKAFDEE